MHILKVVGLILVGSVVIVVVAGLVAPTEYFVERTVSIQAAPEVVFSHVRYWKEWHAWSPWAERDSTMRSSVSGEDGAVGSVYSWVGHPKSTGRGEMANTGVTPNTELRYHLHFIEPWESRADGYVRVTPTSEGCDVAWAFLGRNPFPWNVAMLFMSMDKMIGPDFERGLELLKGIAEKDAAALTRYPTGEVEFPGGRYAAIRGTVPFTGIKEFFMQSLGTLQAAAATVRAARLAGAPVGLYFAWDEKAGTTDMAVGIPVTGSLETRDIAMIDMAPARAVKVDYHGPYEGMVSAYGSLSTYFHVYGLTFKAPAVEEYVTDPAVEPDTTKWLTRIYFLTE